MKVTVVQLTNDSNSLEKELEQLAEHSLVNESQFILLPEMPFFDWLAASNQPSPERWQQAINAHNRWIAKLEKLNSDAVLSTRPIITTSGSRRNEAYIWDKVNGAQGFHQKRYLPDEPYYWEATWYDMGDKEFDSLTIGDARIGVQICTEMWFYQHSRDYSKRGIDLLCVPRATPHEGLEKWLAGGQAGAVVSGAYHLSSNLYAPVGASADLGGLSWIISPEGDVLAQTTPDEPFATVNVDLNFSRKSKSTYPRYVKE